MCSFSLSLTLTHKRTRSTVERKTERKCILEESHWLLSWKDNKRVSPCEQEWVWIWIYWNWWPLERQDSILECLWCLVSDGNFLCNNLFPEFETEIIQVMRDYFCIESLIQLGFFSYFPVLGPKKRIFSLKSLFNFAPYPHPDIIRPPNS